MYELIFTLGLNKKNNYLRSKFVHRKRFSLIPRISKVLSLPVKLKSIINGKWYKKILPPKLF